jgi:uncharacterized SAM-binding protein YcdF (DUF218 family)
VILSGQSLLVSFGRVVEIWIFGLWLRHALRTDFPQYLDQHRRILKKFGVPEEQLHLDGAATDTVTNFTTLADDFVDDNLQHIYLITSDYHMRRSSVIATVVLGSRGVVVTPVSLASGRDEDESLVKVVRDFGRSLLWVLSGRTGAGLNPRLG